MLLALTVAQLIHAMEKPSESNDQSTPQERAPKTIQELQEKYMEATQSFRGDVKTKEEEMMKLQKALSEEEMKPNPSKDLIAKLEKEIAARGAQLDQLRSNYDGGLLSYLAARSGCLPPIM